MAFLTEAELVAIGFARHGKNVRISKNASFYGVERISIGDNVRIDDFCVISAGEGGIEFGNYIHISVNCSIIGSGRVTLGDFSGLASRVAVYSSNDDYSGVAMTNPTVPDKYRNVLNAEVEIGRHVIVGSGTVVLPGVRINEGCSIGALSLVNRDCESFGIYFGCPAKRIGHRDRGMLEKEKSLQANS